MRKLRNKEVRESWKRHILPIVKKRYETDDIPDIPARSESFNNYVDSLQKDGCITEYQARTIAYPKERG